MEFKKMESNPNFVSMQESMLKFWEENNTFEKSVEKRDKELVFYDGPPFPTGKPHHGTVISSFMKDMIARYWTMNGYSVPRVWGWDCHGLPTETQAEKILGITDKKQIESEIGIDKFNEACYNIVANNNDSWAAYIKEMCRWVDYDNSYKTMDKSFMESVLWSFKECYNKDLIYQDYRVTPYCYRCETALSISDTKEADSTRPRQDTWCIAKFKTEEVINKKPVYLLAWTTTPWTLPANMALAVNEEFDYAYVDVGEEIYIAGKAILPKFDKVFGEEPKIIKEVKGKKLENITYEPLFSYFESKKDEGAYRVVLADFVILEEGVGIVHTAPAFGEDDYWLCKSVNVPLVCPVDEKGRYTDEITEFAGENVISVNMDVLRHLRDSGKSIIDGTLVHNYPHCWRCREPLIYKAMDAWYFSVVKLKDKLLKHNESINWIPDNVKHGRFGKWLENARDWNISRNRYWSTPIPVWKCDKCPEVKVLGSIAEIKEVSGIELESLHRQYMDEVTFKCSCKGTMTRVPEVLDCWYESGAVPFAQKHYPFENKEWFDSHFPCDFIVEYTGQIRGWFYYLHVLAIALFDQPAFKNCVVHGTILDGEGKKLSKSSKNYSDSMDLMKSHGTDAYRLYLFRSPAVIMNDLVFDDSGIKEQVGQILLPLYNCTSLFNSYAILDDYYPNKEVKPKPINELDKWILAKLYDTEKQISKNMNKYQLDKYPEPLVSLITGFSNWYLRRSRRRFWASEKSQDKQDVYETTYYVLINICKMLAPLAPVISENLYKHLTGEESVHLADWPNIPNKYKDEEILHQTNIVQKAITLARSLREKETIKIRQPLNKLDVAFNDKTNNQIIENFKDIIMEEINVKNINVLDEVTEIATIEYLPNLQVLGPKYGPKMKEITNAIKNKEFTINEDGYKLLIDNKEEQLSLDDVIVRYSAKEDVLVESDGEIIVSLDILITDELKEEGMAREIVRNIQDSRKQLNCEISDRIKIELTGDVPTKWTEYICGETLADIENITKPDTTCEVISNDKKVTVLIKK